MSDSLSVVVGGTVYTNWTSWSVDRNLLEPADAWTLTVADPTPAQLGAVTEGEVVTLRARDQVLVRGYVDQRVFAGGREGDQLTISGRSLAAPLVDCGPLPSWSWKGVTLARLAELALTELGVGLSVVAGVAEASEAIAWVKPEPGETFWALLGRFAKRARLMIWDEPERLVLSRPTYGGASVGELRWWPDQPRTNVLRGEVTWKVSVRRNPIVVIGQRRGSDSLFGGDATLVNGVADPVLGALGLNRPIVLTDSGLESNAAAQRRATTELSRRAGEALMASYTVPGLGPTPKTLWTPDTLVDVSDRRADLQDQYWIAAVHMEGGRDGARSTLSLRELGAILPESA